ncbi:hypothetical protein KY347_04750 [Candidatus Woesearchaeota archaeon]|nr:hypothetical protein [Candidatus Woesearchaeota archaeon]
MYQNKFIPCYEVLSKSSYSIGHGCSCSSSSRLASNDFPDYAAMFYSPTEHEVISRIKYGNFEQDYSNLREIQQSLNGPPIEFYIPHSFASADGSGRQDENHVEAKKLKQELMKKMNREAIKEIKNAQKQVKGRRVRVEFEDVLLLRKIKKTVVFEEKEQDI